VGITGASHVGGDLYSNCAVTGGAVRCWGWYSSGGAPALISGLSSGQKMIEGGDFHYCSLSTSGGVKCWGQNDEGQLGNGSVSSSTYTPVDAVGLAAGVTDVTVGADHTCAVTAAGGVKCWGRNVEGQLGTGDNSQRTSPTDVQGLTSGVVDVAAGKLHTCAVLATGSVRCWGGNTDGQLGDGFTAPKNLPTAVSGITNAAAVAVGDLFSCALLRTGGVACWGGNGYGELGSGNTSMHLTPVPVLGFTASGALAVSAGNIHACLVTTAGKVKCWGYNGSGQVGDGTTDRRYSPVDVLLP